MTPLHDARKLLTRSQKFPVGHQGEGQRGDQRGRFFASDWLKEGHMILASSFWPPPQNSLVTPSQTIRGRGSRPGGGGG